MDEALHRYRELLQRVDEFFNGIASRQGGRMKCAAGCHSCCQPGLTVGPLEAAFLREELAKEPGRLHQLLALEAKDPFRGSRCSMLGADGRCGIYELRPIVCRSHGAPLQFASEEGPVRDACPLNFTDGSLASLPSADVINIDTVNTLLTMLSKMAGFKKQKRTPLKASALGKEPAGR